MAEEGLSYLARPLKLSSGSARLWLIHRTVGASYDPTFINREISVKVSPSSYDDLLSLIDRDRIIITIEGGKVRNAVDPSMTLTPRLVPSPVLAVRQDEKELVLVSRSDLIRSLSEELVSEIRFTKVKYEVKIGSWLSISALPCGCCSVLRIRDTVWLYDKNDTLSGGVMTVLAYVWLHYKNLSPRGATFTTTAIGTERLRVKSEGGDDWEFGRREPLEILRQIIERHLVEKQEVVA